MATGYTAGRMVAHNMVTTQFEIDGFRVTRTLGVVRGIVVRSRSIFGTIGAGLQTLVGGNITLLTNLCEKTRQEAFDLMLQHAAELGANAVVGARYDATEVMQGVTEVLAYGTAVFVEPVEVKDKMKTAEDTEDAERKRGTSFDCRRALRSQFRAVSISFLCVLCVPGGFHC